MKKNHIRFTLTRIPNAQHKKFLLEVTRIPPVLLPFEIEHDGTKTVLVRTYKRGQMRLVGAEQHLELPVGKTELYAADVEAVRAVLDRYNRYHSEILGAARAVAELNGSIQAFSLTVRQLGDDPRASFETFVEFWLAHSPEFCDQAIKHRKALHGD